MAGRAVLLHERLIRHRRRRGNGGRLGALGGSDGTGRRLPVLAIGRKADRRGEEQRDNAGDSPEETRMKHEL